MHRVPAIDARLSGVLAMTGRVAQVVKDAERRIDRDAAPRFTPFTFIRRDEHGLSDVLAALIDPHGAHGQGTAFLNPLLRALLLPPCAAAKDVRVRREHASRKYGQIDILVETPRCALVIEMKPYAKDQPGQISRYWRYLRDHHRLAHKRILYVTPDGHAPSPIAFEGGPGAWPADGADETTLWRASLGALVKDDDPAGQSAEPAPISLRALAQEWRGAARPSHVARFIAQFDSYLSATFSCAPEGAAMSEALSDAIIRERQYTESALEIISSGLREKIVLNFMLKVKESIEVHVQPMGWTIWDHHWGEPEKSYPTLIFGPGVDRDVWGGPVGVAVSFDAAWSQIISGNSNFIMGIWGVNQNQAALPAQCRDIDIDGVRNRLRTIFESWFHGAAQSTRVWSAYENYTALFPNTAWLSERLLIMRDAAEEGGEAITALVSDMMSLAGEIDAAFSRLLKKSDDAGRDDIF